MTTTESSTPVTGGPYMEEDDWSDLWNGALTDGVLNRTAPDVAGVSQRLLLYSDVDGRQVKVTPGSAHVHGKFYRNNGIVELPVALNSSGDYRRDRVVLRSNETGDAVGNVPAHSVRLTTIPGEPGEFSFPAYSRGENGLWDVPIGGYTAQPDTNSVALDDVNPTLDRMWASQDSGWMDYTPQVAALGGYLPVLLTPAESALADPTIDVYARWRCLGDTAQVAFNQNVKSGSGSTPHFGYWVNLPVRPAFTLAPGVCRIQNGTGRVESFTAGCPFDNGGVVTTRFDDANLAVPDGGTWLAFSMTYEIAADALP